MILKGSATNVTSATTLNRATRIRVNATNAGTVTIAAALGTFNAASAVDDAAITISSHGFTTGDEVTYSDGGGTSIAELTDGGQFFVRVVDANTINLASVGKLRPLFSERAQKSFSNDGTETSVQWNLTQSMPC